MGLDVCVPLVGALAGDAQRVSNYHPKTGEKIIDVPQVRVTAKGIDALAKILSQPRQIEAA